MKRDQIIGRLVINFVEAAHMANVDISYGSDIHNGVVAVYTAIEEAQGRTVSNETWEWPNDR